MNEAITLEAYVLAIERHFRTWRGTDHVLSPKDFALARSWYVAGVPLADVLVGVDRAFESDPQASSLVFCRRRVEELVEDLAAPALAAGGETVSLRTLEEALTGLEERLLELNAEVPGVFALVLPRLLELRDLVAVAARPNWDYLRTKLRALDQEVECAAPRALDPEGARTIEEESARSARRHEGRVDAASLAAATLRLTRARARERLRIPRVSVL